MNFKSLLIALVASTLSLVVSLPAKAQSPSDLFISEYVEGSSNNKALEFYNGTGAAIDLTAGNYVVQYYFNGSTSVGLTINLTGTVAANGVFVLAQASANSTILAVANQTNSSAWFNGDDAIVLRKGGASGTIIDVIGQVGFDPGTEWGTGAASTADNTLRRKSGDCAGDTNAGDVFDPAVKYDGYAVDVFTGLGSHTSTCITGAFITLSPLSLNFNTTPGVPSAIQSYTVRGSSLTNDIVITIPSPTQFGVSLTSGGPFTNTVTVPAASANAGPVTVYVQFSPLMASTQSGNITHISGTVTANLAVQGVAVSTAITPIYVIQGSGAASLLDGTIVTTEGIVTADFQATGQLNGFYIQDTTGDGDQATSDGIFVFNTTFNVNVGDYVRIVGEVDEFSTLTELKNLTSLTVLSSGNPLMNPVNISLPVSSLAVLENYEGMLVRFPQTLTATETFTLARFGELPLSINGRLFNPTNIVDPNDNPATGTNSSGNSNVAAVLAQQDLNNRSRILLDDGSSVQNPPVVPYLNPADTTLRIGTTVANVTGVLDYAFDSYRLQPTQVPVFNYATRPAVPSVGAANVKIASFNVLNYFNGDGFGGGFPTSRGANTAAEFTRQRVKIINAIKELNADVVGLIEIESDGSGANSAIADLVNGLNAATAPGTYAYVVDPTPANGGIGSDEIKQAIIYKSAVVTPDGLAKSDPSAVHNRPPVAQTFVLNSNGEKFTVVVCHFKSKSCSGASGLNVDQLDGQSCYNESRKQQATALVSFVSAVQASSGVQDVVAVGDFNAYEQEDPIDILRAGGLSVTAPGVYSYVFQGQTGSLDYALITSGLASKLTGADKWHINSDEPVAKDYNQEFNPAYLYSTSAFRSSDHDPVLVGLNLQKPVFTLQVLHASDFESGGTFAPNFAAIVDTLEGTYPNTVLLASGDNWIPSPFYNASSDRPGVDPALRNVYNQFFGAGTSNFLRAAAGRVDISILNVMGFQASVLGNHEFDAGTSAISDIIGYEISGTEIRWMGAQFPYLSSNLNFGGDALLSPLFTSQLLPNTAYISRPDTLKSTSPRRKIAPYTIINVNGEQVGVVGATTQVLESISSTGGVTVKGSKTNNMAELATFVQPAIDSLTNRGINKVILLAHLQQIAFEKQLVSLLNNVDIVIAGGSSTLLSDGNDVLRPGDVSAGEYPYVSQNLNGQPALVVNTDQEYKYVGRLVLTFDHNGVIQLSSLDPAINGVYATTDQTVTNLWGSLSSAFAPGTKGNRVKTLVDAVNAVIIAQDGNIVGKTDVYLEGRRIDVRTQETNLGNLSNDANIAIAKQYDATVKVAIKNGGGIRTSIGEIRVNPQTNILEELPPLANPLSGKKTGEISQLDVANSLRFNNSLSLVTVTATQLLQVLNHGVAATVPGATPGQFAQVGGVAFSFNPSLPAGSRVRSAAIIDSAGNVVEVLARNGLVVGNPSRAIRVVTLTFLLTGGDSYPFNTFITANPSFANRVDLVVAGAPRTGSFRFTDDGSEQDAFAEYMGSRYGTTPYATLDTDIPLDRRIQNLSLRGDSVLPNAAPVVSISSPANNSTIPTRVPVSLIADANDVDGTVSKVEFYVNGGLFATDNISPYRLDSLLPEAGNYQVVAKAFDNKGDSSLSDTVRITIEACTGTGFISAEGYTNIPGSAIFNLTGAPNYPNNPDVTAQLSSFEYGPNYSDNYGGRLRGYICAPQSGLYTFYIASDEQSELWLSTDLDPANKQRIAYLNSSVPFRGWLTYFTQKSQPIYLVKGFKYYVETLHKEGTGTDHLSVGWVLPDGTAEGPIPGNRLSPYIASAPMPTTSFKQGLELASNKLNGGGLTIKVMPNPSSSYFTFQCNSNKPETLSVTVFDASGRVVEKLSGIASTGTVQVGKKISTPGVYYAEVQQGQQKQVIKLVRL